ncbi:MAG: choline TMA-lyase-activating enzyme [Veillonella sp.]|uniref:choline TMA-lyase-activating enzyme n=1 Tax=Veillonella sp. TaxID=1926307 RepID=UPI0025DA748D|nr:choline TMA-lyase-activating enzyme [Veillonella sp.]MBS4913026.1 choline TMA-lyase-activating enzyme [Veillonella sp.]
MSEQLCIERKARIFNVQKYSIYDGPGIRTLIFFKGCPLRCRWCANPEGLERKYQVMYQDNLCIRCGSCVPVCPMGIHSLVKNGDEVVHIVDRETNCVGCRKCESVCPRKAIHIVGQDKTITELVDVVQEDSMFYLSSGGGVTLGGGEVSTQPEAATDILRECQALGIHTAIETCGYAKLENLLMMAKHIDLFLFDIKQIDSDVHAELTGVRNERILENLQEILKQGYNVKVRMPLIRGLNSHDETIRKTMEFLMPYKDLPNFKGIDILPYHKLGVNKYAQLDKEYTIKEDLSFKQEELEHIESIVKEYDMDVKVVKH